MRVELDAQTLQALSPLPETALQLLAVLSDPHVALRDLAALASHDLGLSTVLLRRANSPLVGWRGHVSSVDVALRVLGLAQFRLLVVANGVSEAARLPMPLYGLPTGVFRRHSEVAATVSMVVANQLGSVALGTAHTAGLLHDMGKIVLQRLAQRRSADEQAPLAEEMRREGTTLWAVEEARFGADHTQIARQLAEHWGLPAELREAIAGHHAPLPPLEEAPLTWCVAIANALAGAADPAYPAAQRTAAVPLPAGLHAEMLQTAAQQALQAPPGEESYELLGVSAGGKTRPHE